MNKPANYLLAMLLLLLAACNQTQKVNCINRPETWLLVFPADTSMRILLTGTSVAAYRPGTNFTVLDSFISGTFDTVLATGVTFHDSFLSRHFDEHDWILSFYPSGRQFKIRNITRHSESKKLPTDKVQDGYECINPFSYYVNDTLYNVPGESTEYNVNYQYINLRY